MEGLTNYKNVGAAGSPVWEGSLFKTKDGVDIFKGNWFFFPIMNQEGMKWIGWQATHNEVEPYICFSTQELVEQYISENKK